MLVVFTGLSIVLVEVYHTKLPVYGVFLTLLIPAIYIVPCGIIQGITNVDANQLNVLSEFISGYMFAGRPLANMILKILSEDVVSQGIFFAQVRSTRFRTYSANLSPGPGTRPLLQSRPSHRVLRTRIRCNLRSSNPSRRDFVDAGQH